MTRGEKLFANCDGHRTLVFVDDWRGSDDRQERAPTWFIGRSFYVDDAPALTRLLELLESANARDWHARKGCSLFKSAQFEPILAALEACRSEMFLMIGEKRIFGAEKYNASWNAIQQGPVGAVWSSNAAHAKGLYLYLDWLGQTLDRRLPAGTKYRVIVDRLDWLKLPQVVDQGFALLGQSDDRGRDVWACVDKDNAGTYPFLPLLGLVDSEAWALGRMQTRQLENGSTIYDQMTKWQAAGIVENLPITEAEVTAALDGSAAELRAYWDRLTDWSRDGKVVFVEPGD